ncbi:putative cyclase [Stappia aggregata IAM 12614]|uniref:Putative cyclase n=1 Tax=Roseibium aggregatum (strain ATCC 25650 / DSM 13394 / JCM 20685 / NBRC 16684 / NCIMB 2208 / IAM 12614 / B1) TaxID=384765 RepID=A0P0F0_ROSAI|nr:cyclase family protein [Roseibium aggregatum]5NNB_A Chain A, isatin hydrolase A [Roseibium aggregatum]5NNB_B Chain B, isatin hydrolase A [Roseibium aggregatum]5NNB_C Chain C, isatin hydrolase A [Roseibium aggregatum]5NNB_D Chain D, isatin hydrolase A [Roseibium aggregatum]EAV41558.1 putative cyclase [Stappia aggregata IAM 12614] [Roseibium aggregatum IAM 12614]
MSSLNQLVSGLASGAVRIVDLTHTLDPDFPVIVLPPEFGQCARFRMEEISAYDHRGPAWKWHNISMSEHTGTHFDAPSHWISGKDVPNGSVDEIPAEAFVGPVVVIDCSKGAAENDDFELTPEIIAGWESEHGRIPEDAWVLMRTDWSKRRGADYLNMRADGPHSPGPTPEAIRFLIEERNIRGFGTETVGTDAGQGAHYVPPYPAHYLLHGAGKYGLQCLANLDQLPATGAVLIAAPLKIKNGTGSPLRVLAMVTE